jgi:hypothetical protein
MYSLNKFLDFFENRSITLKYCKNTSIVVGSTKSALFILYVFDIKRLMQRLGSPFSKNKTTHYHFIHLERKIILV